MNKKIYFFLKVLSSILVLATARPEPPRNRYGPPPPPQQNYGPPAPQKYLPPPPPAQQQELPQQNYGAPPPQEYGPPPTPAPAPQYGPPAQEYGPPPVEKIITKNVYVHIPPEEPVEYTKSQQIEVSPPKKHYKIIFIKAPAPPTPTAPIIPVQEQDEHKTLVYVLVKKPEPQPEIEIPLPEPTEPSKPEVYFIKYKQNEKEPAKQYGPPGPY